MTTEDLVRLPGLGPRSTQWLAEIGITSHDDVDALESLLLGCDWRDLPADRKAALRAEVADG